MQAFKCEDMGVSQNWGYTLGGLYNKDYGILGSILGSPYLGALPYGNCRRQWWIDPQRTADFFELQACIRPELKQLKGQGMLHPKP